MYRSLVSFSFADVFTVAFVLRVNGSDDDDAVMVVDSEEEESKEYAFHATHTRCAFVVFYHV